MRRLTVYDVCVPCKCQCIYSVNNTCRVQRKMHLNCILCTTCTVQCTCSTVHVHTAVQCTCTIYCAPGALFSSHTAHSTCTLQGTECVLCILCTRCFCAQQRVAGSYNYVHGTFMCQKTADIGNIMAKQNAPLAMPTNPRAFSYIRKGADCRNCFFTEEKWCARGLFHGSLVLNVNCTLVNYHTVTD